MRCGRYNGPSHGDFLSFHPLVSGKPRMQITRVRTKLYRWKGPVKIDDTVFATPLSALPFQSDAQAPFRFFSWLVVEVETDDGHPGIGNAGLCPDVTRQIVDAKLTPLLVGENPLNTEYLFEKMYRSTVAFGRKGAVLAAISAVDIALWDVIGKALSAAGVHAAWAAGRNRSIPSYYSRLYTRDLDRLQAGGGRLQRRGLRRDEAAVRLSADRRPGRAGEERRDGPRHARGGGRRRRRDGRGYMGFDFPYAQRLLKRIEPYHPRWVEELLLPDEIHNFAKLRKCTDIPLSGGEHEFTRYGFHDLLQAEALDIFQFDTNRVGGFTEARKICAHGAGARRRGDSARRADAQPARRDELVCLADGRVFSADGDRGRQRDVLVHLRRRSGGRERPAATRRHAAGRRVDAEDQRAGEFRHRLAMQSFCDW